MEVVMKNVLVGCLAGMLVIATAHAQSPMLKITVDSGGKTKHEVLQRGSVTTTWDAEYHKPQVEQNTREVVMTINIQNTSGMEARGLMVKYAVFRQDKATRKVDVATRGEQSLDIRALQTVSLNTTPATFEAKDVKFNHGQFTEQNKSTGSMYYGIGVTVYSGTGRIASYFVPSGLGDQLAKYDSGL
jgi:hypothetical protein